MIYVLDLKNPRLFSYIDMDLVKFYSVLACITFILSVLQVTQVYLIPLLLSTISLVITTLIAIRIDGEKHAFVPFVLDVGTQVALTTIDIYAIIPLLLFILGVFSYINDRYIFYRILISSSISAFSFPIAYSVSFFNLSFAPIFVLQVTSLVTMREAIVNMKIDVGKIAYSIILAILIALSLGKWETMIAITVIGIYVLKNAMYVYSYRNIVKILTIFSLVIFMNFMLPFYIVGL